MQKNPLTEKQIQTYLEHAKNAARLGREVLLNYFGNLSRVEEKHQAGLVSEADHESEKAIANYLQAHCPECGFLGEESHFLNQNQSLTQNTDFRFIVDPLDGTTNYVHQFPIFCISIALEYKGQMVVAVIDAPKVDQLFCAGLGLGATLNGEPIHVSNRAKMEEALLATGFFSSNKEKLAEQLRYFNELIYQVRGVRRAGAAAYDLAMVASGVFDGFWEQNLSPWDTAAGFLLVTEAGGKVTTNHGETYTPFLKSIVASNGHLHEALLKGF